MFPQRVLTIVRRQEMHHREIRRMVAHQAEGIRAWRVNQIKQVGNELTLIAGFVGNTRRQPVRPEFRFVRLEEIRRVGGLALVGLSRPGTR